MPKVLFDKVKAWTSIKWFVLIAIFVISLYIHFYEWINHKYKIYIQRPEYFAITSYGHTGTTWLASVLNKHVNIVCSHRMAAPDNNKTFFDTTKFKNGNSVQSFFNWLVNWGNKETIIVGNVHGFRVKWILDGALYPQQDFFEKPFMLSRHHIEDIDRFMDRYQQIIDTFSKPYNNVKYVNMIRHPITRVQSSYSYWSNPSRSIDPLIADVGYSNLYDLLELLMDYGFAIDNKNKIIFLLVLLEEQKAYADLVDSMEIGIPQIRYEDVTKEPQTLGNLIKHLSNGKIIPTQKQLEEMITTKPMNVGIKEHKTPESVYSNWQDWQKLAFYWHLKRNGKLYSNAYTDVGYDLSCVDDSDFAKYSLPVATDYLDANEVSAQLLKGNLVKTHAMLLQKKIRPSLVDNYTISNIQNRLASGQGRFIQRRILELIKESSEVYG